MSCDDQLGRYGASWLKRLISVFNQASSHQLHVDERSPHRVLISHGRCGTHWLKRLISTPLGIRALEDRLQDPERLKDALQQHASRRLIYEHFRFDLHGTLLDPSRDPRLRLVLLHRHPLDQFISVTWFQINMSGELSHFDPGTHPNEVARGLLLGHYDDRLGYSYRDSYLESFKRNVLDWVESRRCHEVKYENLIERTEEELMRCLDFLEIRYIAAQIPRIVKRNRFEVLSGGRAPGVMIDGTNHYRRGQPGEWRTVFRPEDLPVLREKYGDYFERQGYPI